MAENVDREDVTYHVTLSFLLRKADRDIILLELN